MNNNFDLKSMFHGKMNMWKPIVENILKGIDKQIKERCASNPEFKKDLYELVGKITQYGDDAFFRFIFVSRASEVIQSVLNMFEIDFQAGKYPVAYSWLQKTNKTLQTSFDPALHFAIMNSWRENLKDLQELISRGNPKFWKEIESRPWGPKVKILEIRKLWEDRGITDEDREWFMDTMTQLCEISEVIEIISPNIRKRIEKFALTLFKDTIDGSGIQTEKAMNQIEGLMLETMKDKNIDMVNIFPKFFQIIKTLGHLFSGHSFISPKFIKIINDFQNTTQNATSETELLTGCQNILQNTNIDELTSDPQAKEMFQAFKLGNIFDMLGKPDDLL